jgi:tetratricopeptide (TPR) repeat protein
MKPLDGWTAGRLDAARRPFGRAVKPSSRLALCLLVSGCAYYNGMYNAKRFAKQAERSERLGRTSEAAERWRVAAIHAESVVTRHPHSRWADDAMLLRARALVHLESWADAARTAELAAGMTTDEEARREAWLYLGLARIGERRTADALAPLDSAAASANGRRRSAALLARGRAHLALGRPVEALEDFRLSTEGDAAFERARAALAAGDGPLAARYADTLADRPFFEAQWLMLLDSLAHTGRGADAARLTDRLVARTDLRGGPRARLLLAEGERRLEAGDDSAAAHRFRDALRLVPDSVEARTADVRLARLEVRAAGAPADLALVRRRLDGITTLGGTPGREAQDLARLLDFADSLATSPRTSDAFWFLRGELLRDSLGARALAADAFATMPARFPDSPWTPKGVLAAIALDHPAADSLRALLLAAYATSPYTMAAEGRGDDPERFAMLEDSLRTVLATLPQARPDAPPEAEPGLVPQRGVTPPRPATPPRSTTRPTADP